MATAARLFAARPFHKVTLDDVAAGARVGKGTLYVYFDGKEELYFALIYEGFTELIQRLEKQITQCDLSPRDMLRLIIAELVAFAIAHPHFFELIRAAVGPAAHPRWEQKRLEMARLIEDVIRRGNRNGQFEDPHPEITAVCVPGLVRSVMLYVPKQRDEKLLTTQITRMVEQGLNAPQAGATGRNGRCR